jgi:type II secretory ATPase GspE/PulE/Tfp pilus assembly ATPase PilB-like protein
VGQRLTRRLCDDKEEYTLDAKEREKIASPDHFDAMFKALADEKLVKESAKLDTLPFYHPKPGGDCEDGYKSRMGIHEILTVSPAIRELILHSASPDELEAQARKEGMLTMLEDGLYKAARGITSIEEVLRAVNDG